MDSYEADDGTMPSLPSIISPERTPELGSGLGGRENGGKTCWDGGPLIINPIYTLYHVCIYWVYTLFKGSLRG